MLEDKIKNAKFYNSSTIEIFCDQQFDSEYYLRGRIYKLKDFMINLKNKNEVVKAIYHFAIIVLVNDEYLKKINKLNRKNKQKTSSYIINVTELYMDDFVFPGNTKEKWLQWKKKYYESNSYIYTEVKKLAAPYGGIDKYEDLNCKIITLKEIERLKKKYKGYLEESKKLGKDSIVLGIFVYLENLYRYKKFYRDKKFYPNSTFIFPIVNFSKETLLKPLINPHGSEYFGNMFILPEMTIDLSSVTGSQDPAVWDNFIKNKVSTVSRFHSLLRYLVGNLHKDLEYDDKNYTDSKKYNIILESIGDIGYEILMRQRLSKKFREKLGRFKKNIGDRVEPVIDFCYRFFDDLEQYLSKKENIRYCPICGNFYRSEKKTMYCEECSKQRGDDPELKAYDEIKEILEEYGISQNMPLEDIYDLSIKLIERKEIIVKLLRDKKIRENPQKRKYRIDEELSDILAISESLVKHAKY